MKKMLFIAATYLISFSSCKKEATVDEVTYEVTLENSTTWHGAYLNKDAQVIGITGAPTNWNYTFKNTNNLIVVTLNAYSDGLGAGADANMKIYVNGTVVTSGKSSVSPQIQYQFP